MIGLRFLVYKTNDLRLAVIFRMPFASSANEVINIIKDLLAQTKKLRREGGVYYILHIKYHLSLTIFQ